MPLDICSLNEWKNTSGHWSQKRSGHTNLREIDTVLQEYHAKPKEMIGPRILALDKIMVVTDNYRQNKSTGSILGFLRARREKKVLAAEALYGQAAAKKSYLTAVQEAEMALPTLFGKGGTAPQAREGGKIDWQPVAQEILGLQQYIGPPDQGRVLNEDYWTEAIDPLHRNWNHPTNSPVFQKWIDLRHVQHTTTLSFYRWFETLTDQQLLQLAPHGLLQTAYQNEVGRGQYRVYVGGASHRLRKLTAPDTFEDFSTADYHTNFCGNGWGIFVISTEGQLYINNHDDSVGWFHAAFMGGKPVTAAGEMYVRDGVLHAITPKSGHYKPRPTDIIAGLKELRRQGLDLTQTQVMAFKRTNMGRAVTGPFNAPLCNWYDANPYIDSNGVRGLIRTEEIKMSARFIWNPNTNQPVEVIGDGWLNRATYQGWVYPANQEKVV